MSEILLDFESRPPYEIHTYVKEVKTYLREFFQTQPNLNQKAWSSWLDEVRIDYRSDELTNQLWTRNVLATQIKFNAFLKCGAKWFLANDSHWHKKLATQENYLKSYQGFTQQKVSSQIDIGNKHILMLNHVDEGVDEIAPLIRAPGIDNKKYFDFVFFHELGHALFYDFMDREHQKIHINVAGLHLLSQMLEKAENNTLNTALKNTQHSMHEAFSDLVGLYMMYHKNDLDKDDFFPVYRLFISRRRGSMAGEKVHDTTDVLDYLIENNMEMFKKDFAGFINDAFALSIAVTYEKLQKDIESHEVMYNLARRVISEDNSYFYELAVNEKVVGATEFRHIVAHRESHLHIPAKNYNMLEPGILLDYILQQNQKESVRLKTLPNINQPAVYNAQVLDALNNNQLKIA